MRTFARRVTFTPVLGPITTIRGFTWAVGLRFDFGMPALTRRRYPERLDCWHIYYGDVKAGTIARVGLPHDRVPWERICGFYPGSEPGEYRNGMAATFDRARAAFEQAWQVFLSKRTEADFQAWRDQRDRTARKYALWDAGKRRPPNEWAPGKPCSIYMKCLCGEVFNSHQLEENLIHIPHITAAHQANEIHRQQTA